MLEIELRFPAGRYHATPWDHHVNEGIVEWPPSPWRLLRALVATWHLKSTADEAQRRDEEEETLRRLVWELSGELPRYALPAGVPFHTRHYMPLYRQETTKVFDTFLHVGEGAVLVRWPEVELSAEEARLLDRLLDRLGYLGRAESWVEGARRTSTGRELTEVTPIVAGEELGGEGEPIRVLAPLTPARYASWRSTEVAERQERRLAEKLSRAEVKGKPPQREKLTAKDRQRIAGALPESLFDALHVDTGAMRKAGWSDPPGSRWVDYRRPKQAIVTRPRPRRAPSVREADRTVARFALASAVLPRLTEAVALSERVRKGLMSQSGGAPVFAGKDAEDKALKGHQHAYLLPEANARHGRISHITIYAAMGFDERTLRALHRLARVWGHGGHDIQTVLLGVGTPETFSGINVEAGQCPLLTESRVWFSRTPFVPTRHPKATRAGKPKVDACGLQIGSAEHDLRRLLRELRFPEPVRVDPSAGTYLGGKRVLWSAFRTQRKAGGGQRASNLGYGFCIEFDQPVRGPIALGYGAHFGLGVLLPEGVFDPVLREEESRGTVNER